MTREEALAYAISQKAGLESELHRTPCGYGNWAVYSTVLDFINAAISALKGPTREQVEKVWRGEWVKRHKRRGGFRRVKGFDDMGEQHEVTIDERCEYDDLYCSKCGKQSPDNFLNFCGYCGAPMTDKAVDMVMERLEAMYENRD